jgi:hypothetical protein
VFDDNVISCRFDHYQLKKSITPARVKIDGELE